jgi:ribosome-dependent ATPase
VDDAGAKAPVVSVRDVRHRYGKTVALDGISVEIPAGLMVGVVGPDGVGKSTLLALIAGSKKLQQGTAMVLGGDIADAQHRRAVFPRIAYMPQGLGKNLYRELSVHENIDFMARLFGLSAAQRRARVPQLLEATGLAPFPNRPAGKLSGGMKQKVSLCGALVHEPDLLILDEPTTGVDPLSRRQFWALIESIRRDNPTMSVLISTAYMDEAQQWDWLIAMDAGKVLATGSPADLMRRTGVDDLEKAFIRLLPEEKRAGHVEPVIPPRPGGQMQIAIDAKGLTRRFGSFTAVDRVSLSIERGEIFGFLGSNGCGKSTTMKMLTGLLPPTEGTASLFGQSVEAGSIEVRRQIGYMTQAFSLYEELTVRENMALDARLYHIPPDEAKDRIEELIRHFGLESHMDALAADLPMGLRQRLSLAVAVLHKPAMLILDEPTSGVDPVARDSFWELLIDLSRRQGVTIFVTTHFMNEAMRCDRISLMHAGKVLACDAPRKLIEARGASSLENAFIAYMEDAIQDQAAGQAAKPATEDSRHEPPAEAAAAGHHGRQRLGRLLAYALNETMQIMRDPVRLAFAFLGSVLLMLVFGFGITTDVENIRFAAYDQDQTPESREYLAQFSGASRYFDRQPPVDGPQEAAERLQSDAASLILELPPDLGREFRRGSSPQVLALVDGANPFRGETISQYVQGVHDRMQRDPAFGFEANPDKRTASIQDRFMYNPTFESIYVIVPSVPALLLVLIPAILMAVAVVREKELGSIINFYVTPTGRLEYLLGKQLPYIAIGMINYLLLVAMAVIVFGVAIKGSFWMLTLVTLLYVTATTGIGLVTSTFTRSQVAAVFITAIITIMPTIQFSGMLQPVSTLQGQARLVGTLWPTTYYMHASVGTFTKGLSAALMTRDAIVLLCSIFVFWGVSIFALKKQEK